MRIFSLMSDVSEMICLKFNSHSFWCYAPSKMHELNGITQYKSAKSNGPPPTSCPFTHHILQVKAWTILGQSLDNPLINIGHGPTLDKGPLKVDNLKISVSLEIVQLMSEYRVTR